MQAPVSIAFTCYTPVPVSQTLGLSLLVSKLNVFWKLTAFCANILYICTTKHSIFFVIHFQWSFVNFFMEIVFHTIGTCRITIFHPRWVHTVFNCTNSASLTVLWSDTSFLTKGATNYWYSRFITFKEFLKIIKVPTTYVITIFLIEEIIQYPNTHFQFSLFFKFHFFLPESVLLCDV